MSTIRDGDELAAVDLGSNSFHMVVARYEHQQLRVIDRLRESVRLAGGLQDDGTLSAEKRRLALGCLAKFGQRIAHLPDDRVWAVGTNTVRRMKNPRAFLVAAETALGHPIEIVSGREEARLIYLGAAHGIADKGKQRLVIDIGGGSTEFIIGLGFQTLERESLQMGCVATTKACFPEGKITEKRYEDFRRGIVLEMQQFVAEYRARGWVDAYGCSGTIKTIAQVAKDMGFAGGVLTQASIAEVRAALLKAKSIDSLRLPGLTEERRPVFPGGFLVLDAAFEGLRLKSMNICETAMREGLLYDMLGRAEHRDPRMDTIDAMCQRYGVDETHAGRVESTALRMFDAVAVDWNLDETHREWLTFAAKVHEIGLAVAHSQHHHHGEYLLEHSDMAGFTKREQDILATLVRSHRRGLPVNRLRALSLRYAKSVERLVTLLRLSALLHRSRIDFRLPKIELRAMDRGLRLTLPGKWLSAHPLTLTDLEQEIEHLREIDFTLVVAADN